MNSQLFWNNIILDKVEIAALAKIDDCNLIELLNSSEARKIFSSLNFDNYNIVNVWKLCIERHAAECEDNEKKLELLVIGIASLLLFIQQNWTGPDVVIEELPIADYSQESVLSKIKNSVSQELVMDGENIVSLVQYPELLLLARLILLECNKKFNLKVTAFWLLRCLFVHQQILEESSSELYNEINKIIDEIKNILNTYSDVNFTEEYLEFARIHLYYNHIQKSKLDIEKALQYSKLQTSLTGALGKRTKFQQEDLAQLTLKVDIDHVNANSSDISCKEADLPLDVKLEDEVRLNKIKFKNDLDGEYPDLSGLHQAVLLAIFCQTQKSQPKDKLADEELQPLISCILDKPKIWSIMMSTLLFRSRLESNHKRGVERSMMQVQSLVDNIKNDKPTAQERFKYFFVSYLPPTWDIESTLAKIMVSMGAIKSGLEIYLRLEEWENVINCYNALEMRPKAREIIEQELKKNPSPKLWCFLGDATGDVSHFQTAWKMSNGRSAQAQRHWAMFYYNRREYDKSIIHFQKSLEVNSLQSELWYRLGYAALHEEKWEISAGAYRRYCVLDSECFEAWNNLARCYCELKQKRRAWRALREALKVDYSNWRVWDNYMLVSSDLKEFDEVVRSYHEVLNLKEKHVDIPILKSLVYGFKQIECNLEQESLEEREKLKKDVEKFREKLLTLFGRLTSQVLSNSDLWYLYSEVTSSSSGEDRLKKQKLLSKAYSCKVNKQGWVKTMDSCSEVVHLLCGLIDASIAVGERSVLLSSHLSARGCLASIKKEHPTNNLCEELEDKLKMLNEKIDKCS